MNISKKYRWIIVVIAVVAMVAAAVWSYVKPVEYDVSIAFSINRINKQETADYQYDGYYAIQASDLFSQTVMSWMMTPSVLLEMYELAGIDPQITTTENFTSRFKVKKFSSQNIAVRFSERDEDTAQKIAAAITQIVEGKASAAIQTSDNKAFFEVIGAKPLIVETKPMVLLNMIIGLVGGLLIATSTVYAVEYLRNDKRATDQNI